jgi:hypothetical protein
VGARRFLKGEYLIDCNADAPDITFVINGAKKMLYYFLLIIYFAFCAL